MDIHHLRENRWILSGALAVTLSAVVLAPMLSRTSPVQVSLPSWTPAVVKTVLPPIEEKEKKAEVTIQSNPLVLQTLVKDYVYTFTGTISCGGQPWKAAMEVLIEPDGLEATWTPLHSEENGRFWFQVPFKSLPNQKVDWTLTLRDSQNHTLQTGGRHILTEESTPTMSRDFDIP